jgi:hypothetical protein
MDRAAVQAPDDLAGLLAIDADARELAMSVVAKMR